MQGMIYGIGVGPGDPELMTLKAVRLLREADVIAIPGKEKELEQDEFITVLKILETEKNGSITEEGIELWESTARRLL